MECKCTSFNKYKICRILLDTFFKGFQNSHTSFKGSKSFKWNNKYTPLFSHNILYNI